MRNCPKLSSNSIGIIRKKLRKKAAQTDSKFKVSALAFDEKNEFVGQAFNLTPQFGGYISKPGAGIHAESKLMRKYGRNIKTIVLSRIGHGGNWRPIEPCENCRALAKKLGVKIITIDECKSTKKKQ